MGRRRTAPMQLRLPCTALRATDQGAITRTIQDNFWKTYTIDELAGMARLSPSHFRYTFKRVTGRAWSAAHTRGPGALWPPQMQEAVVVDLHGDGVTECADERLVAGKLDEPEEDKLT
jgi:AraC-like DNA-binding protein